MDDDFLSAHIFDLHFDSSRKLGSRQFRVAILSSCVLRLGSFTRQSPVERLDSRREPRTTRQFAITYPMDALKQVLDTLSSLFHHSGDASSKLPGQQSQPEQGYHGGYPRHRHRHGRRRRSHRLGGHAEIIVPVVMVTVCAVGFLCCFTARVILENQIAKNCVLPQNKHLRILSGLVILVSWVLIRVIFLLPLAVEHVILFGVVCFPKYRTRQRHQLCTPFAWMDRTSRNMAAISLAWIFRGFRRAPKPAAQELTLQPTQICPESQLPEGHPPESPLAPPAYGLHVSDSALSPPPPTYKNQAGNDEQTLPI
ncbi:hypothetical protein VD0003_g3091 [Verticillium dahliae]|nr:hypothetical protein VD0003_g3091 [Verticillium dahliae]